MYFKQLIEEFCSVFLPFRCHSCRADCKFLRVICDDCIQNIKKSLRKPELVFDVKFSGDLFTMSSYDSFLSDVIRLIKYRPSNRLMRSLLHEIEECCDVRSVINSDDIVIPVPMHSSRQKKRGFNQAELLAEKIAAMTGADFSPALQRIRATRPQADCNEDERLTNLDDAFSLAPGLVQSAFARRRLILIDDVATTGTTLQQCANILGRLSPTKVVGLVISHSFRRVAKGNDENL